MDVPDSKTTRNTSSRISVLNAWRHNTIKNIKITVRNTRYAVHDETNNQYSNNDMKYIDCYFEHLGNKDGVWNSTQAYAAGMGSVVATFFENCTFKSTALPFSMHDNFNVESNRVKISKCTFITGNGEESIRFGSYGTGAKKSIVTIENCNIDKSVKLFEEQGGSRHGNHLPFRVVVIRLCHTSTSTVRAEKSVWNLRMKWERWKILVRLKSQSVRRLSWSVTQYSR